MARIMHVITGLGTGGAEKMLLKLLSATRERYAHAVVSLMDEGTTGEDIAGLGVPVHCLRMRPGRPNPVRALSIRAFARKLNPHLVQGWMYHGNLMASVSMGWTRRRPPVIWSIHHTLSGLESRLTKTVVRLDAFLSRRADSIIYVSRASRSQHEALGYCSSQGVIIPNGIDCQVFRPDEGVRRQARRALGFGDDAILIGLVARYHPMKDHAGFLRAAASLAGRHPSAHFVLIGPGTLEQPELATLIAELRMQDRVVCLGERKDTPQLTAALDIACSASAWGEAFSNAIAEAMACGVPCVVTDVGDSAYLVGDTGLVVPPRDPNAMAAALERLIAAGPDGRRELGTAARCRIEHHFSLPAVVDQYEALYRKHLPPGDCQPEP